MEKVIEQAAQALAACMDYPWEYMPEQGRQTMRDNARKIIGAALAAERERLALLCDAEHVGRHMHDEELDESDLAYNNGVRDCASWAAASTGAQSSSARCASHLTAATSGPPRSTALLSLMPQD